jgi:EAL domain-containing protein (putative c-di-GMP-specific phosphodiesterase class I)
MGVSFSIDQFGINDTAFGYLQSVKIDQLKVDGSYIHGLHQNKDNQFFLRSLTAIAHNLDIKIFANFVEQKQELQNVESLGLDGAQGYYVGLPETQG